jgi:urate oxidase
MSAKLAANNYGKSRVRLVRVTRDRDQHNLKDICVGIQFEGEFETVHTGGDNTSVLPTDTMKNTVYALAGQEPVGEIEAFGKRLTAHFLKDNPQVSRVTVEISENLWARIPVEGKGHSHAFVAGGREQRTATVTSTRTKNEIEAGIANMVVLKTRDSAFAGYIRDPYTTLKETRDRVFATAVTARWLYDRDDVAFEARWLAVRESLLKTFAEHKSESVQHTLFAMGEAVLAKFPDIGQISISMPNKHHLPFDLSPFGMENRNEVFVPTEEPHGLIEATIVRS